MNLKNSFIAFGIKKVSKTDITKGAYVLNHDQLDVLRKAGYSPGRKDEDNIPLIKLREFFTGKIIKASFYESIRKGSGRTPEHRMGRFLDKVEIGDTLFFGTDGKLVYFYQMKGAVDWSDAENQNNLKTIYGQLDDKSLYERAKASSRKPRKKNSQTKVFERSQAVVAYVQKRSGYKCEVEECNYTGFLKGDGSRYIETHHIERLADGGKDSIDNAVAVCPNCHKKLHFGKGKESLAKKLKRKILKANQEFKNALNP